MIGLYITLGVLAYLTVGIPVSRLTHAVAYPGEDMDKELLSLMAIGWPFMALYLMYAGLNYVCVDIWQGRPK